MLAVYLFSLKIKYNESVCGRPLNNKCRVGFLNINYLLIPLMLNHTPNNTTMCFVLLLTDLNPLIKYVFI